MIGQLQPGLVEGIAHRPKASNANTNANINTNNDKWTTISIITNVIANEDTNTSEEVDANLQHLKTGNAGTGAIATTNTNTSTKTTTHVSANLWC